MHPFRFLVPAVLGLGLGLVAAPASAQTVTVPDNFEWMPDNGDRAPTEINRADCLANATIQFKPDVVADSGQFQVWAGSACTDPENRRETGTCVQVATAELSVETLSIRVQDMLQDNTDGAGPNTGMATACDEAGSSGKVELHLFFMVIDQGDDTVLGTHADKTFYYDIFLPPAPTGVTAGPGEASVELEFTPGEASDLKGYRFYCSEAGASGDGTCTSSTLMPGEDPPTEKEASCGEVTGMAIDSGTATGRSNGVEYAVGVAAIDNFGNVGKLSELACATPKEVTGFFEAYRAAGGQAGGGFCSFAPARRGTAAFGVVLLLGGLALVRRRR
jgi:hypothetical protein